MQYKDKVLKCLDIIQKLKGKSYNRTKLARHMACNNSSPRPDQPGKKIDDNFILRVNFTLSLIMINASL